MTPSPQLVPADNSGNESQDDINHLRHPLGTSVTGHPVLQSELRSTTLDRIVLRSSSLQRGRGSYLSFLNVDLQIGRLPAATAARRRATLMDLPRRRGRGCRQVASRKALALKYRTGNRLYRTGRPHCITSFQPNKRMKRPRVYGLTGSRARGKIYRSNHRFVASNTANTAAVSGLSRTSALPVMRIVSRPTRDVTPTNTNSRSNASTTL